MRTQVTINAAATNTRIAHVRRLTPVIIARIARAVMRRRVRRGAGHSNYRGRRRLERVQRAATVAVYRDQLARPISGDGAHAIVAALTDLYVRDGYVKPELVVDDALIGRGVLRVHVYEAQVTNVIFEGDGGRFRDALDEIGARLENTRPLRREDVPKALREMRQIAGLAVTATTRRDAEVRNAFELVVRAEFSPLDGVVRMNNRGTDQVGPAFLMGQMFANGLLGRGEKIGLIFAAATDHDEYLGGGLYFDTPFGSRRQPDQCVAVPLAFGAKRGAGESRR